MLVSVTHRGKVRLSAHESADGTAWEPHETRQIHPQTAGLLQLQHPGRFVVTKPYRPFPLLMTR